MVLLLVVVDIDIIAGLLNYSAKTFGKNFFTNLEQFQLKFV